jgi:hypothetical protein
VIVSSGSGHLSLTKTSEFRLLTREPSRHNNRTVRIGSIACRGVAVIASLVLLAGSLLPPAHIHFAPSATGQLIAVAAHQHLAPHRMIVEHDFDSIWDHDDDGVVQTINQHWLVPAKADHSFDSAVAWFATTSVPPIVQAAQFRTVAPTISPPDPLPKSDSLRAPPLSA